MHYFVSHTTVYQYDRPVSLSPHVIRLRPRADLTQTVSNFTLDIAPAPTQVIENIDLDGNNILIAYFSSELLITLQISTSFEIQTHRSNPFAYLLEPWVNRLPLDYPASLQAQLQPYFPSVAANFPTLDPVAVELANDIWHKTDGNPVMFLWELNQQIFNTCQHIVREQGDPFPPSVTWKTKTASCRDMTVLFIDACRAMGLATRFVSGYHEGDPDWEHRHLHAWAEVYLPGAGWRGYDPTQGLAVGDRHIALVAAPNSRATAPISGSLKNGLGATTEMQHTLTIKALL